MIIVIGKTGQTANRLFLFAHLVAFAAEHGLRVSSPAFDEYGRYFEGTHRDLFSRFPAQASLLAPTPARRLRLYKALIFLVTRLSNVRLPKLAALFYLDGLNYCELSSPEFQAAVKGYTLLFVSGWRFLDLALFDKHADQIRRFFQPVAVHRENVAALIGSCRDGADVLIGVHIRRGDYKEFSGGRYFYSHQDYAGLMHRVEALFPGQQVRFLICSNETVPAEFFQDFDYRLSTNHLVEDMYALADCDYLLGPESTYTMWASFYGQVPLYQVYDLEKPFTRDSFTIRKGQF